MLKNLEQGLKEAGAPGGLIKKIRATRWALFWLKHAERDARHWLHR